MIRLENLTKTYKKQVVLDHLTHEFARGRIHGIIGRNGSGKTTLLRMICGIAVPTEGEIYLDGKPVSGKGIARFPADIGIVIENTGFIAQASGYRNLEYLASIRRRIGREEIVRAMERVGLDPADKKWVGRYSLGMKQRLGIAQAIMESPSLLLLDEPMNGLDKQGVSDMRALFAELRDQGLTILLASHSAEDIDVLCDTVVELDHGKLSAVRCGR